MPDSFFCDHMGLGITFSKGNKHGLRQHQNDVFSCFIINTNGLGKTLSYNRLRQMGSISLE